MSGRSRAALAALVAVGALTIGWWALALWPVEEAPTWLDRVRTVCFGNRPDGLPDAAGWTALVLQPAIMLSMVFALWGRALWDGVAGLGRSGTGRAVLTGTLVLFPLAATAVTLRVTTATDRLQSSFQSADAPPSTYPRLDRPAPALALVDQHGDTVTLERFRGMALLVTFAYAHCETVCPVVVRDVLAARRRLAAERRTAAVIVTLDPWRDVPSRLPSIAERWGMRGDEHVLSGSVSAVEPVLDAWGIARQRDSRNGEISHPRLAYVVDGRGSIAYAVSGGTEVLAALARRLDPAGGSARAAQVR